MGTNNFFSYVEFNNLVDKLISEVEPNAYAIVAVDLDNFNFINDLFGYSTGDKVLRILEEYYSQNLKEGEYFSRTHADHFVFLVKSEGNNEVGRRFTKLCDVREQMKDIIPLNYNFVCSGGIAIIDDCNDTVANLTDKANFARKHAKGSHYNTVLFYSKLMREELEWKKHITFSIEAAIENNEFEMYIQPKVNINKNEIVGAEALVRWNSPSHGLINPDRFIPILEQNGFIREIDFFMLQQVCKLLNILKEKGKKLLPISVNFSKVHLVDNDLVEHVHKIVSSYGVEPSLIEVELTESIFTDDLQGVIDTANAFKKLVYKLSLDDFGRAYSALNYLKDVPLDIIKIDKSFFDATTDSNKGKLIIKKVIELIKSLNLVSVMEGIETQDQVDFLKELNCDLGQGYFYARPMPMAAFLELLDSIEIKGNESLLEKTVNEDGKIIGIYALDNLNGKIGELNNLHDRYLDKITKLEEEINKERSSKNEILRREERYRFALEQMNDIVFEWDIIKDILLMSDNYKEITGRDYLVNNLSTSGAIKEYVHPDDVANLEELMKKIPKGGVFEALELRIKNGKEEFVWFRLFVSVVSSKRTNPERAIGVLSNINEEKSRVDSLTIKSQLDPLTKLLNKEELRIIIQEHLETEPRTKGAFVIIDIDNFKSINDNLGHQFGDTVLQDIASKTDMAFGKDDVIGRLGGDEFTVFVKDIKNEKDFVRRIEEFLASIRYTYFGATSKYKISGSIGYSIYPENGTTFKELYQLADIALYESKAKGKDTYTMYIEGMESEIDNIKAPIQCDNRFINKYFAGDPIFNIFEMLYETKDINIIINSILELLGKRFNVDRVYIFEKSRQPGYINSTYEWCSEGIKPEIDNLQNVEKDVFKDLFDQYNEEGILVCSDINTFEPVVRDFLDAQGIKSILHCAINNQGEFSGFIGFDLCKEQRMWQGDEIATLGYISRILSVFLVKTQIGKELLESYNNHVEMLDNLNGFVYVIDADTYETLYVNNASMEEGLKIGNKCYYDSFGLDAPCENCPVKQIKDGNPKATTEVYSKLIDSWVSSAASKINWAGRKNAALICCTDVTKYKK